MKNITYYKKAKTLFKDLKFAKHITTIDKQGYSFLCENENFEQELEECRKLVFIFDCVETLLDDREKFIVDKEIKNDTSYYWRDMMSRSSFYRIREATCKKLLDGFEKLSL